MSEIRVKCLNCDHQWKGDSSKGKRIDICELCGMEGLTIEWSSDPEKATLIPETFWKTLQEKGISNSSTINKIFRKWRLAASDMDSARNLLINIGAQTCPMCSKQRRGECGCDDDSIRAYIQEKKFEPSFLSWLVGSIAETDK